MRKIVLLIILAGITSIVNSQDVKIALLKYSGGGDWYANPTSLSNLATFCNNNLHTQINTNVPAINIGSVEIYNFPIVHITGHGNVIFSPEESENLRQYLISGGFLHISDNYGLDKFIRREMKKVFPGLDFVELPHNHPIYHQKYDFNNGLPKIHEHDDKDPQGLGLVYEGRLVCFYDFECDLGDGWEDPDVHNDPHDTRLNALRMGANILQFAFSQ